jgi:beta-glucanase (GH16 family)
VQAVTPGERTGTTSRLLIAGPLLAGLAAAAVVTMGPFDTRGEHQVPAFLGSRGSWTEVFEDGFDDDSLDRGKWQPYRGIEPDRGKPFNPDEEAAWFSPDNVSVADGTLNLAVQGEPATIGDIDYPLSSGMVETGDRYLVEPGSYVEARIKIPRCDGCWPAFWLVHPDRWPPEIDIMEWGNTGREDRSRPTFNYIPSSGQQRGPQEYGDPVRDYRGGFHTYGVLWNEGSITPVVDGVATPEVAATKDVTDKAMMVILNLSVKAGYEPAPGSRMEVDWVRVWRPADQDTATGAAAGAPVAAPWLPPAGQVPTVGARRRRTG